MPLWNAPFATQAEFNVLAAEVAALNTDTLKISANGSDIADDMLFRANIGAVPLPTVPTGAARRVPLSGYPFPSPTSTLTVVKDIWRFAPIKLDTARTVAGLGVNTVVAASAGTAVMIFGLFTVGATGRPDVRQADWSTYGSIDLTAAPGELTLATAGLTIPAGEWFVGLGWAGTAAVSPTMTVLTPLNPSIGSTPLVATQSGYSYSISGASVPATVTAAAAALTAPAIWTINP